MSNHKNDFIQAGFDVLDAENSENKLLNFLKENYPQVLKGDELNLSELKHALGLPVDEKTNGYGLNFVGRNVGRAKYSQKTDKELALNPTLSKNIDQTQNLVLKGDNLDSLKILKHHYSGKIKCIYIDPPYNTNNDNFVYPDRFNKEEAEVLGLANLSDDELARMDFHFTNKKNHNGWLTFMYPRLLLAKDLLSKDGVIFISIDDNEQANLKLLCDDVFGEENFVANFIWEKKKVVQNDAKFTSTNHEYILAYKKTECRDSFNLLNRTEEANARYSNPDNDERGDWTSVALTAKSGSSIYEYTFDNGVFWKPTDGTYPRLSKDSLIKAYKDNRLWFGKEGKNVPRLKKFLSEVKQGIVANSLIFNSIVGSTQLAKEQIKYLLDANTFDTPKPTDLIQFLVRLVANKNDLILDFFAGSGTTGHAIMQLNTEDGGNRKFILCQIDEPIAEGKEAYKFCLENGLPPVISSITIERLKRAGEKIAQEVREKNSKAGMFEADKKQVPDIGYKVFDSVDAPKLTIDDTTLQMAISGKETDAISRIYNMIFSAGIDAPSQVPEVVLENCIYRIDQNYYLCHCDSIPKEQFAEVIQQGSNIFIDGWTASLNGTLQHYKENIKIIF